MDIPPGFRSLRVPVALLAFVVSGCASGSAPTAPGSASSLRDAAVAPPEIAAAGVPGPSERGRFVDLQVGRVARQSGTFRARTIPTGGDPGEWIEVASERTRTVEEEVWIAGVPYRVEHDVLVEKGSEPFARDALWRQDRSGLYLLDDPGDVAAPPAPAALPALVLPVGSADHATAWQAAFQAVAARRAVLLAAVTARGEAPIHARVGGGPGADEITFLRYPLHPGASWEGRIGFNVWTVEAREVRATPAGRFPTARLRIELPAFFGPDDSAVTWWGAPGEVAHRYRLWADAVDANGQVIGRVETIDEVELVDYVPGGN